MSEIIVIQKPEWYPHLNRFVLHDVCVRCKHYPAYHDEAGCHHVGCKCEDTR